MNDCLGKVIKVGDAIISFYSAKGGKAKVVGRVAGFTKTQVGIKTFDRVINKAPKNCVLLNKEHTFFIGDFVLLPEDRQGYILETMIRYRKLVYLVMLKEENTPTTEDSPVLEFSEEQLKLITV